MKKQWKTFCLTVLLSIVLVITGCSQNEEAAGSEKEPAQESKTGANEQEAKSPKTGANEQEAKSPKTGEKEVNEFVLKNTKIVKIFGMSQRVNPDNPELGPFYIVRGIDERGQKSEVWVKDLKIHDITNAQ